MPMIRERSRWASRSEYSGKAWRSAPGVPKKLGREPAASTRLSPVQVCPSPAVTVLRTGSIATTSAILTSTLRRWKSLRNENAASAGRQLARRDLVEQGLELVVVVLVDQRHADVVVRREPADAAEAGEPAPHDDDVPLPAHAIASALLCAGAPRRSSRWSPTRNALAMAVSAGFTAPMLGKKLVSTT